MINYNITHLPTRENKPRKTGITMVMDKGLSLLEAQQLVTAAGHLVDFVKLGFGTSLITGNLAEKIDYYKNSGIDVYLGGTLFEAFLIRNNLELYKNACNKFNISTIEISDGSVTIPHELKLKLITQFSSDYTVISEVGSKYADVIISDVEWSNRINKELKAGATYVIAEGREGGNVGIYDSNGKPKNNLIEFIRNNTNINKIIWEAPNKPQQVWFVKLFGTNVNLGNIPASEVISLETLRLGLRSDTFFDFLPNDMRHNPIF